MIQSTYDLLNVPVTATDKEIRKLIQERWFKNSPGTAKDREWFKRAILRCHHEAQRIYHVYRL